MYRKHVYRVILVAFLLVLSACSQESAPQTLPPTTYVPMEQAAVTETAVSPRPTPTTQPTQTSTVLPPTAEPEPTSVPLGGIGVIGDSNSDEYRADDNRGGEYAAVTLNWIEQLAVSRGLNFGEWGTWDEPRRTGYAYNWSRSGANVHTMLSDGQVDGLAAQIAAGEVAYAIIYIGTNDFSPANGNYAQIYDGSMSDEDVAWKVNRFVADVETAVSTLQAAGDVHIILGNVADPGVLPGISTLFPKEDGRQRVTDTVNALNASLANLATAHDITFVDLQQFALDLATKIDADGYLILDGTQINMTEGGNNPIYMRLGDNRGHPGTVISGLLANALVITPLNQLDGVNIPLLTDTEILANAGLR
ncbi:MAG: GDSL-type esterase/lipase family protein [Chloroflexota bacterium]